MSREIVASYCVPVFRPVYARRLLGELVRKTSVPYEIRLWLNCDDALFEEEVQDLARQGVPVHIDGKTPENIGMQAFKAMFSRAEGRMLVQLDDDVVAITPGAAEIALDVLEKRDAGLLGAHVWQDDWGNGGRPALKHYILVDPAARLFKGPIDGGFTFYRREVAARIHRLRNARYFGLGVELVGEAGLMGLESYLTDRILMFHVNTPAYHAHFGMLDFEIKKYRNINRNDMAELLERAKDTLPPAEEIGRRVAAILRAFEVTPGGAGS